MRWCLVLSLTLLFPSAICTAQELIVEESDEVAKRPARDELKSYAIQATEFKLDAPPDSKMNAAGIVQKFTEGGEGVEIVQTIQLSAIEGYDSSVQFGSIKHVTTGFSAGSEGRRAPVRVTKSEPTGTIIKAKPASSPKGVVLQFSYEKSQLEELDDSSESQTPEDFVTRETMTSRYEAMLLLELGKPKLVGGTSGDGSTYLVVSISEQTSSGAAH